MRRCFSLACLLALLPALASADEVFLKGGGKLSGRILSRTDTSVQVDVGAGIITVPMASVVRIEEKRSVLDEYEERAAKVRDDDVQGWLQLARWSLAQQLGTQARRAYERVVALDPQNVEANQALGRVQLDGRWVTEQESYRSRGFVQFEGQWMTPEERDAIVEQRDARYEELARIDAERRARDAEMRAASAEARASEAEAAQYGGIPLWWGGGWPVYGIGPGYAPGYGYGRGHRGRRSSKGSQWPPLGMYPSGPLGMYPSSPLGTWPSFPVGGRLSYPIGPAGNFPIGPSPPGRLSPIGPGRPPGIAPPSGPPGGRSRGGPGRPPGASGSPGVRPSGPPPAAGRSGAVSPPPPPR